MIYDVLAVQLFLKKTFNIFSFKMWKQFIIRSSHRRFLCIHSQRNVRANTSLE